MLKIGVLGAGHLGKIHLRLLNESSKYELIGFYDCDMETARGVSKEFGYRSFDSIESLAKEVDVIDIVTPTTHHFSCAKTVIEMGKHIFIEKPIASTVEEAFEIGSMLRSRGLKGQVGHVERFNPAFVSARNLIVNPMFIEAHRLCQFNPRGTDVPVVLDLMIHDIDTILSVVKSSIVDIRASGVSILSDSPDIASARIEFENGCVANVTASRISMKNMRKSRFFQKDAYISVDFLDKKVEVVRMKDAPEVVDDFDMVFENANKDKKQIYFEYPTILPNNAILSELETFADAIEKDTTPSVTIEQGIKDLEVAYRIVNLIESQRVGG